MKMKKQKKRIAYTRKDQTWGYDEPQEELSELSKEVVEKIS
jgi:hypothetical protein